MAKAGLADRSKAWLHLVHRWIGIVTCLLFLIWFLSGLVMIYVPFPHLSDQERLSGLPRINWPQVRIGPAEADLIASRSKPAERLSLEMLSTGPVWRITPAEGGQVVLSATSGVILTRFRADAAAQTASAFGHARVEEVERLERDQWTVAGSFNAHRPLYRVRLRGEGGRDLYVSSTTGAVMLDTNRIERFWNWLGSVPHWIYPTVLRQHQGAWRQVVLWVAGPCILAAVTGIWIGLLRARFGRRRFKGGRTTPYHGWMLWHHVAGLAGGLTLTLWIFSGWLSVDPGRLFASPGLDPAAQTTYDGAQRLGHIDHAALATASGPGTKRVRLFWAASRPWLRVDRADASILLDARTLRPATADRRAVIDAARQLVPTASVASVRLLTAPDFYWYDLSGMPQLPMLRIIFDDPAASWVHIDPSSGTVEGAIDRRGRLYRWIFDLFHKWDFSLLVRNRPAWEAVLWALSLLGIVTSASGIWIAWKRLRRSTGSRKGQRDQPNGRYVALQSENKRRGQRDK